MPPLPGQAQGPTSTLFHWEVFEERNQRERDGRGHPERSEGSAPVRREILRCAQDDSLWQPARFQKPYQ